MINLNARKFTPLSNSENGRVQNGAMFIYQQIGIDFTATYDGLGVRDGHIIGKMTGPLTAELIYHSRATDGTLEAGQAIVNFEHDDVHGLIMHMDWQWLNGSKASGKSLYGEVI